MGRFKPGQQVVCVVDDNMSEYTVKSVKKGNVYTVRAYDCPVPNFLTLIELPDDWFKETIFEPLMDISELTAILESETITERV